MTPLIPALLAAALVSGCGFDLFSETYISEPWPDDQEFGQEGRDGPAGDPPGPPGEGESEGEAASE